MRYGYARVSTRGQKLYGISLDEQREKLLNAGIPDGNIYVDDYTGTKMERPEFDKLMAKLQSGDEFVVCKLDRFARTAPEGALLVRDLVERGIKVNILNMGVADNTPLGKMLVTVLLAFAEYERDMIVERTSGGKAWKREHDPDWKDGRKPCAVSIAELKNLAQKQKGGELTVNECCERLGISRSTWYNLVRKIA